MVCPRWTATVLRDGNAHVAQSSGQHQAEGRSLQTCCLHHHQETPSSRSHNYHLRDSFIMERFFSEKVNEVHTQHWKGACQHHRRQGRVVMFWISKKRPRQTWKEQTLKEKTFISLKELQCCSVLIIFTLIQHRQPRSLENSCTTLHFAYQES